MTLVCQTLVVGLIVGLSDCQEEVGAHIHSFRYGYAVQDDEGNDFNQQEQSDGEQVCFLVLRCNSVSSTMRPCNMKVSLTGMKPSGTADTIRFPFPY